MAKRITLASLQEKLNKKFDGLAIIVNKKYAKGKALTVQCASCKSKRNVHVNKIVKQPYFCSCLRFTKLPDKDKQSRKPILVSKERYHSLIERFIPYIASIYRDVLKLSKNKEYKLYFDKNTAFNEYEKPVSLSVICHPANIHQTNKKHSSLSVLNRRIRAFEKKHGSVHFPPRLTQVFTKEQPKTENVRILGMDPGTQNFGIFGGIFSGKKQLETVEYVLSKNLKNPIRNLTDNLVDTVQLFRQEIKGILETFQPDVIVIERFQVRSVLSGTSAETVSFMIGIVQELALQQNSKIEFKLIIASNWKNAVNRLYDDYLALFPSLESTHYHRLDAMLQAYFGYPLKNQYENLKKDAKRIAQFVAAT